jgi:hypothetical protein
MKSWRVLGSVLAAVCAAAAGEPAQAEVTRFEVVSIAPAYAGTVFDKIGAYEKITAKATVAIDPADPRNAVIADIARAPRNPAGRVESVVDVEVLRPVDPRQGNHTLFYEVLNRGHKMAPGAINDAAGASAALDKASDAGNGYLMRQGYTLVWSGWQGDFAPRPGEMIMTLPTLKGVAGRINEEILFDNATSPAVAELAWPAADRKTAKLIVRERWDTPPITPKDMSFRFVDDSHVEINRPAAGFDAGALYTLSYEARDPKLTGLAFAATRDVVAFLRSGRAYNPLAAGGRPDIQRAYAYGQSQGGRFLREYLYLGFNEDVGGKRVFEGMMPQIGGARFTAANMTFGLPGRSPRHPQDPASIADRFPFTYAETTDPFTGVRDSLLARCRKTNTCPKVIQTDSEYEWWGSRASLLVTDPAGQPITLPPDVRVYLTAGAPHSAGAEAVVRASNQCVMPLNPIAQGPALRVHLSNLDAWVTKGVEPPPSRTPSLADGSLVAANTIQPASGIPGVPYTGMHNLAASEDLSTTKIRGEYKVYVPRLNADGMAVGGLHLPAIDAPKATYTGWNPHLLGDGPTTLCPLQGGAVAFAATRAERLAKGDPRPSLEERYPTPAAYVAKVDAIAQELVRQRMMLAEELPRQHKAAVDDTLARLRPAPGAAAHAP